MYELHGILIAYGKEIPTKNETNFKASNKKNHHEHVPNENQRDILDE
jgi:hypothetical protein